MTVSASAPHSRTVFPAVVALAAGAALAGCRAADTPPGSSPSSSPATPNSSPAKPNAVATVSVPPDASAPTAGAPDQATIQSAMNRTVEVANPSEHFTPVGTPVSVSGRNGGTLTALIGQRTPNADAHGQLVFFWQGNRFLGWDAETEAMSITKITGGTGYFQVTYAHYAANDPACCPSLPPVSLAYVSQDEDGLVPSGGTRPTYGDPVRVKLNP